MSKEWERLEGTGIRLNPHRPKIFVYGRFAIQPIDRWQEQSTRGCLLALRHQLPAPMINWVAHTVGLAHVVTLPTMSQLRFDSRLRVDEAVLELHRLFPGRLPAYQPPRYHWRCPACDKCFITNDDRRQRFCGRCNIPMNCWVHKQ